MSGAPKMTPWFDPDQKPFHVGIYQTQNIKQWLDQPIQGYQNWNGEFWGIFNSSTEGAALDAGRKSRYQRNYWRGLAENPACPQS